MESQQPVSIGEMPVVLRVRAPLFSLIYILIIAIVGAIATFVLLDQLENFEQEINIMEENGVYMVDKKTQDSAGIDINDWQTYRNEEYGFEIKYPQEWKFNPNAQVGQRFLSIVYKLDEARCGQGVGCAYPGEFFVRAVSKRDLLPRNIDVPPDFEGFVASYKRENLERGARVHTESVFVEGKRGSVITAEEWLSLPDSVIVPMKTVFIEYSVTDVILIETRSFPEKSEYVSSIHNQILSTFKFLNDGLSANQVGLTRGDDELILLSLTNGETLEPGDMYSIKWSWSDDLIDFYTDTVYICLLGISEAPHEATQPFILDLGNVIPATAEYNKSICTYVSGSPDGSYFVATSTIKNGAYDWTVPVDILDRFVATPDRVRIQLIAMDDKGLGGGWGGAVGWSMSAKPMVIKIQN